MVDRLLIRGFGWPFSKMFRRPALLFLVACAYLTSTGASGVQLSSSQEKTIDAAVTSFMKKRGIPGCSVSLGLRGALVHAKGYGHAAPGTEATAETVYRIGSLTKQFTAGLALMAASTSNSRPLAIDDALKSYFPDQNQWATVTIRQLLTHTSGIPTYTARKQFRRNQFEPVTHEALLKLVQGYRQSFKPGTRGHYSNTNYLLLAHIIQNHTSHSYADLLQHNIFQPLGMTATGIIAPGRPDTGFAVGSVKGRFVSKRTHPNWALGVGDLRSNVLDVAKWNMALLGNRLLSDDAKALMFTSVAANPEPAIKGEKLAMGWMDVSDGGTRRYYHQGYLHGFSSINYLEDPFGSGNRFVTVLCSGYLVQKMPELAIRIARLL